MLTTNGAAHQANNAPLAAAKKASSVLCTNTIRTSLSQEFPGIQFKRVEAVGAKVSSELLTGGFLALGVALILMLAYIWFRFEWQFGVGGMVSTLHDVITTVGLFALFQLEFNLTTLAAILTIAGYSVNDTVVVFDRIREDFRKMRKGTPVEIMNAAINETLSRTIMTSGVTLLVVIALLILGGPILHGFSLALFVGIIVGTYSSIYIASATALMLGVSKSDLMPTRKEGQPVDDLP